MRSILINLTNAISDVVRQAFVRRALILSKFATLEIVNSVIGFAAGILIVRNMEKTEYAWYTVGNTMLNGLSVLTTFGLVTALFSVGGKHAGNPSALGGVMAACLQYRTIFIGVFGPVVAGCMVYMLWRLQCPPAYIVALVVIVTAYVWIQINQDLANALLRLAGRYNYPQAQSAGVAFFRLLLIGLLALGGILRVWSAMLVTLVTSSVGFFFFLRPESKRHYHAGASPDAETGGAIRKITYNTLPNTLHAFLNPQISVFVLSVFSTSASVADLGALSRFALLYSLPAAIVTNISQPWLAKTPRRNLLRNYLYVVLYGVGIAVTMVFVTGAGSSVFLALLGSGYDGLSKELLIFAATASAQFFCNCCGVVLTARGWVSYLWIQPIISIAVKIAGCFFVDLSDLSQVLVLNALHVPFVLSLYVVLAAWGFARTRNEA